MVIQFEHGEKVWCIIDGEPQRKNITKTVIQKDVKYFIEELEFKDVAVHKTKEELVRWLIDG